MDNKFANIEKEIDERIELLEGFQTELTHCIESLKQMNESATNICEAMKKWRKTNE